MTLLKRWLKACTAALYPENATCVHCHRDRILDERLLCERCGPQLKRITGCVCESCGTPIDHFRSGNLCRTCVKEPLKFDGSRACFPYTKAVQTMIHRMKYSDVTYLCRYFATDLEAQYRDLGWFVDGIVAVPSAKSKKNATGYHAADLLAEHLSQKLSLPNLSKGVVKIRETPAQVTLSGQERRENVKGVFKAVVPFEAFPRILIIDDLLTTGSTINALSKVLYEAGAQTVLSLTLSSRHSEAD